MLNLEAVGTTLVSDPYSWSSTDSLLYALGVGAGQGAPLEELEFTTENTEGTNQRVLPTFAALIGQRAALRPPLGDIPAGMAVHAEQSFELHASLQPAGTVVARTTVTGIYDKGSGALVRTSVTLHDDPSQKLLATVASATFIRGEGGYGGDRGPKHDWTRPGREPDIVIIYATRPEQALLYRLTGDRNPLHSDPGLALRRGNKRPILHGMCTYGFTGRALLHALCDSDPDRFVSMAGRFTRPVTPGDDLHVSIWRDGNSAVFQTATQDGTIVLDCGECRYV